MHFVGSDRVFRTHYPVRRFHGRKVRKWEITHVVEYIDQQGNIIQKPCKEFPVQIPKQKVQVKLPTHSQQVSVILGKDGQLTTTHPEEYDIEVSDVSTSIEDGGTVHFAKLKHKQMPMPSTITRWVYVVNNQVFELCKEDWRTRKWIERKKLVNKLCSVN